MLMFLAIMALLIVAGLWVGSSWIAWAALGLIVVAFIGRLVFAMLGTAPARWTARRTWWRTHGRRFINTVWITVIIVAVIRAIALLAVRNMPKTACGFKSCATATTTVTPAPVPVAQAPTVDEYIHVFNLSDEQSEVWVLPTNTRGWILTWNADDVSVPYEVITDHGTFRCIPGEVKTAISPTRSIAFRSLTDTARTKIRAVLRRP